MQLFQSPFSFMTNRYINFALMYVSYPLLIDEILRLKRNKSDNIAKSF